MATAQPFQILATPLLTPALHSRLPEMSRSHRQKNHDGDLRSRQGNLLLRSAHPIPSHPTPPHPSHSILSHPILSHVISAHVDRVCPRTCAVSVGRPHMPPCVVLFLSVGHAMLPRPVPPAAEDYHQQYLAKPGARPYCSAQPLQIALSPISEWVGPNAASSYCLFFGYGL